MRQPRGKARTKRTGEGLGADDGPPAPSRSWQAPPDGLFDVIVPTLTAKQFVVVQLVCKDWSRSARYCLKDATPKRPDVDLSKLATLYPNLTQLNLSHVEGLTTRMLTPLRQLTALRELCLSNIALKHNHEDTDKAVAPEDGAQDAAAAGTAAGKPGVTGKVPATTTAAGRHRGPHLPSQPRTRSRARGGAAPVHGGIGSRPGEHNKAASPPPSRSPGANQPQQQHGRSGPAGTRPAAAGSDTSGENAPRDSPSVCGSPPSRQQQQRRDAPQHAATGAPDTACTAPTEAECAAAAAGGGDAAGSGAAGTSVTPASPGSSPPLSPASRIFGGLGDVLLRLSKLQADLCPALTADAIASLPNLTDLTLDTLVAPEALAPLARLRCLAVKKLANPEALERLSGLTALLINSDSSCASDFLPVCTRLPELRSLTFKTSSTKVLQQPDLLRWHGFSRLSSLDLRAPAECLKPGLPALSELGGLRNLSLDLYCASDEELMVTVVAPPNLQSLFVSSDRSRSGGVIDVHPNPRLRSLRIRLYWTALNLVMPEGVPEPSPLPEPLSEDLEEAAGPSADPVRHRNGIPGPDPGSNPRLTDRLAAAAAGVTAGAAGAAGGAAGVQDAGLAPADRANAGVATANEREACAAAAAAPESGGERPSGRGLRRRRGSDASPSPGSGGGAAWDSPERGPRRRVMEAGATAAAAAAAGEPPSTGGRGTTAAATPAGDSSNDDSGRSSGGSDGGSSGEEVGFRGAGPSAGGGGLAAAAGATAGAAAAAAAGSGGRSAGTGAEEKADADSRQQPAQQPAMGAAGGAPQANRRESTPRAVRRGAETPHSHRRRSGGSACRSGGGAATPAASLGGASASAASNMPLMELQELCLDACFFLLYGSLVPLLRQFPGLRRLTLDNCLALENGELAQLCELSGLRELSLSGLHLVTDAGLRSLGRLPALASLRVKGLRKLSVHAAQAYMRQKPIVRRYEEISGSFLTSLSGLAGLRSLALKHLHTAGEGPLAAGLGALSQLTRLEVKNVHSMSDKVLLALTGHTALRDLSVLHCEGVTSLGRNAVVRSLGQRVALDLEGCSLPDITRPCALPTTSTQAQLIGDDRASSSNQPPRSCQHSNQH